MFCQDPSMYELIYFLDLSGNIMCMIYLELTYLLNLKLNFLGTRIIIISLQTYIDDFMFTYCMYYINICLFL